MLAKNRSLKTKRTAMRSKPKASRLNQYGGMDMSKFTLNDWNWVYIYVVLDWYTKEIIRTSVSQSSQTVDWLDALNLVWLNEWDLPFQFSPDFYRCVYVHNTDYPHHSLRYKNLNNLCKTLTQRRCLF